MRKLIISVFVTMIALAALAALAAPAPVLAGEDISVAIDGAEQRFDVPARIIDGPVMVPARAVFEALGASVEWDENTQSITASAPGGGAAVLTLGESVVSVNGTAHDIEAPPMIIDGTMMVQAGAVALAMGLDVEWDAQSRTVIIETPPLAVDTEELERIIFELSNEAREQQGLPALVWNDDLAYAAGTHSRDMAENNLTGNNGSDGLTAVDRIQAAELDMVHVSGNAFRVSVGSPEEVFEQLLNNRQRENNILSEFAEYSGVSIEFVPRDRGSDHLFVVQKFGAAAVTDPLEFAGRLFELVNERRTEAGVRTLQWDESLANAARANSRRRTEEENPRFRARDLVFERNFTIRVNEVSPEFLIRSISRHDSRDMLLDEGSTRLGIGCLINEPEPSDERVDIQISLVFATPAEIPEIADPFYIPNMLDAGYSAGRIAEMFEREVFRLTNAARADSGLRPLIWDDALSRAARDHSRDMADNNFFGHTGSDRSSPAERTERASTRVAFADENLSNRLTTPRSAVDRWLNSSRQRANILREDSTHLGVGFHILLGSQHESYLTQLFGRTQ